MWVLLGKRMWFRIENGIPSSKEWDEHLAFAAGNYHRRYGMNKEVIV
jgi:hypothetical protein